MNDEANQDSVKRPVARLVHKIRHEIATIPITFIASIIVIIPVFYAAIQFFISPGYLPSTTTQFPSIIIPVPGLNILVKACGFFVVQGAIGSIYIKSISVVEVRFGSMSFIFWIVAALVYAWLSTFMSFVLWVTATPNAAWGVPILVAASFVSFALLGLVGTEEEAENHPAITAIFAFIALIVFTAIFVQQTFEFFETPH